MLSFTRVQPCAYGLLHTTRCADKVLVARGCCKLFGVAYLSFMRRDKGSPALLNYRRWEKILPGSSTTYISGTPMVVLLLLR